MTSAVNYMEPDMTGNMVRGVDLGQLQAIGQRRISELVTKAISA